MAERNTKTKLGIVVVKTDKGKNYCKLNKYMRRYLADYLDETHKNYLKAGRTPRDKKPAHLQLRGVDYFSTSPQGLVTVHGYLRKFYDAEAGMMPEQTPRDQLIDNLSAAITTAAIRYGRATAESEIAAKIAFSLSPEVSRAWKAAGVDIDGGLRHIVEETLNRYRLAAMEGAELGYAIGVHHDREHFHAHVFLMLHDSARKRLKLSNRLEVYKKSERGLSRPEGTIVRVDFLSLLIGTANTVLREYQEELSTPTIAMGSPTSLSADMERWLNLAACHRLPKDLHGSGAQQWLYTERERLRVAPAQELVEILDTTYRAHRDLFTQLEQLGLTAERREQLRQKEASLSAALQKALAVSRTNSRAESALRDQELETLKTRLFELKAIGKALRLSRSSRLEPRVALDEARQALANAALHNDSLRELLQQRINLFEKQTGPLAAKRTIQDKLADTLNRQNLGTWKKALERQYADLLQNLKKKVVVATGATDASTTQTTHIRCMLDLIKSAYKYEPAAYLDRYDKFRSNPEFMRLMGTEPITPQPQFTPSETNPTINLRL